jgi:hypothetical protein
LDSSGHIGGWLEAKKAMDTLRYDVDTSDMLEARCRHEQQKLSTRANEESNAVTSGCAEHERQMSNTSDMSICRTRAAMPICRTRAAMPSTSGNETPNTSGCAEHGRLCRTRAAGPNTGGHACRTRATKKKKKRMERRHERQTSTRATKKSK